MLLAVGLTAVGFAFDAGSGNKELTTVFGVLYALGCIAAVLAVRQESVFTAVVQPPLILFVAVPGAYFLFHYADINGVKDILINCGYPLIERFVLMFVTTVIVLLIGMARWYFGGSKRSAARTAAAKPAKAGAAVAAGSGLLAAVKGKVASLTDRHSDHDDADDQRKHAIDRPATARRPASSRRPTKRPAPTRSRHARPPMDNLADPAGPVDGPPRRRRPTQGRDLDEVLENLDEEHRPRRPRAPRDPNRRTPPPEYRGEPRQREPGERPARPRRTERTERPEPYEPYDMPPPPPRRRPAPGPGNNGTHHPVSRVRYRSSDPDKGGDADDTGAPDRGVRYRRPPARHSLDDWRYQG